MAAIIVSALAGFALAGCGPWARAPAAPVSGGAVSPPVEVTPGVADENVGRREPVERAVHIPVGQAGRWNQSPPASGEHWPFPAPWGPASQAYPPELWVHNLEHGGIAVLFRDAGDSAAARGFVQRAPRETLFNEVKLVDAPYPRLTHRFALVAWGWVLLLDSWDDQQAEAFYAAHVDRGPEVIP